MTANRLAMRAARASLGAIGKRGRRLRFAAMLAATILLGASVLTGFARAAEHGTQKKTDRFAGTSSAGAKKEARQAIPWNKLSHQQQRAVQYVVRKSSLYRRTPTQVVDCDPEIFNFLSHQPEVVVNVWNLMGISNLEVERLSDTTFRAKDQNGAQGVVRVLHSERNPDASNRLLLYVDGSYQPKPLPSPLNVQGVLLLRSGSAVESNGRTLITTRLDTFLSFDRIAADMVAKTIQPLVVRTADHNFTETMKFVSTFSRTAERNPAGMERLSSQLTSVKPEVRKEMIEVCQRTHDRGQQLTAKRVQEKVRVAKLANESTALAN